jgi:hypothetical protein
LREEDQARGGDEEADVLRACQEIDLTEALVGGPARASNTVVVLLGKIAHAQVGCPVEDTLERHRGRLSSRSPRG